MSFVTSENKKPIECIHTCAVSHEIGMSMQYVARRLKLDLIWEQIVIKVLLEIKHFHIMLLFCWLVFGKILPPSHHISGFWKYWQLREKKNTSVLRKKNAEYFDVQSLGKNCNFDFFRFLLAGGSKHRMLIGQNSKTAYRMGQEKVLKPFMQWDRGSNKLF